MVAWVQSEPGGGAVAAETDDGAAASAAANTAATSVVRRMFKGHPCLENTICKQGKDALPTPRRLTSEPILRWRASLWGVRQTRKSGRLDALDGLRGIAATGVVALHVWMFDWGGEGRPPK